MMHGERTDHADRLSTPVPIVRIAAAVLVAGIVAGCDRGPSAQERADLESTCGRQVDGWLRKQGSLGANYEAQPHYDHAGQRCLAHVRGGNTPATRFETVVDVQHDRILAGCSEVREAVGDTPCQVDGRSVSRAAGRKTIDRLTGVR